MPQLTYTQAELYEEMYKYKRFINKERASYKQTIDGLEMDLANANQSRLIAVEILTDQLAYSGRDIATLNKVVASLEKERNMAAKQLIKNSDKLESIYEALHLEKDESAVSVIRELRAKSAIKE
jgi:hypothetical protein